MKSGIRREDGYTLMELLAVIVVIGILAGIGLATMSGARETGREKACETDVATLRTAAETYYAKTSPSVYGNEFALRADGVIAQFMSTYHLTVGATPAAAASATNSETSSQTNAAYAIKVADAACGTVGSVVS